MPASPAPLPEIPEHGAGEAIAPLYADIRARLGARAVPLLYRVLAVEEGCLPWAWNILGPCASGGVLHHMGAAARLAVPAPARMPPAAACRLAGLDDGAMRAAAAIVSAFNHANPLNLAALVILEEAARSGLAPRADMHAAAVAPTPQPLHLPSETSEDARAAMRFLASCGFRRPVPAMPTLWTALAAHPPALALAAAALASDFASGEIEREAETIIAACRTTFAILPMALVTPPVPAAAAHLARLTPFFAETIPTMIAIGARLHPLFDEDQSP
ncbi:MAG: hypothetical protein MUC89_00665 [Acetobacteraceae bacterium]|jgi:hypothetical protein|nr:hypothetical protein [Acetobacteraceae bacterium]